MSASNLGMTIRELGGPAAPAAPNQSRYKQVSRARTIWRRVCAPGFYEVVGLLILTININGMTANAASAYKMKEFV